MSCSLLCARRTLSHCGAGAGPGFDSAHRRIVITVIAGTPLARGYRDTTCLEPALPSRRMRSLSPSCRGRFRRRRSSCRASRGPAMRGSCLDPLLIAACGSQPYAVYVMHDITATSEAIIRTHGAHSQFSVKDNAPETLETPKLTNWERDAQRRFTDMPEKPLHGRWETRSIECISLLDNRFTSRTRGRRCRITRERKHVRSETTLIELDHVALPCRGIARASPLPQSRTLGN